MKQLSVKGLTAIGALVIGIAPTVWFTNYFRQPEPDFNVYPVDFCVLAENPKNYDGKFVRVKGIYGGQGTDTPTYLTASGCRQRIYETCKMDADSCGRMFGQLRSIDALRDPKISPQIEVVGHLKVNADNPRKTGNLYREPVNLIEITELRGIETVESSSTP